jgi:hypothetical protein
MRARGAFAGILLLLAGCPSRELPPPPAAEEPKPASGPACKLFKDGKTRAGASCCIEPAASVLKAADIAAICGAGAANFAGEVKDGAACRMHFQVAGEIKDGAEDAAKSYVMVSRPIIPAGTPAPMGPDPLLPMNWKKVPLRDALGFQVKSTSSGDPSLLERQTILWAGRGRRVLGLHVSKKVCTEAQALALLQKAIDAVPAN